MKKASCLRMADGGSLVWRWANAMVGNNPEAMKQRNRSEEKDQRPPPKEEAPPPAAPPIRFRDGGGPVPGRGKGDKIPALYEPGEFVVSNEMLEDNPGLEEALHHMRDRTLRADGKDPREIDERQARSTTLRAGFGADGSWDGKFAPDFERNAVKPPPAAPTPPPPVQGSLPAATSVPWNAGGTLRTLAGPVAGAALTGHTIGSIAYENMAQDTQNAIGGTINNVMKRFGGGVDDTAMQFGVMPGSTSQVNATTGSRAPVAFATPDPTQRALRQGTIMPTMSRESPRDLEIGPEQGVVTRVGNSFSGANVSGYGRQNVVPGMSQDLIDQTLTNKDGSRWSAADNARMAANLRDGRDPLEGTSGAQKLSPLEEAQRRFPPGTFGRASALRAAQEQEANALTKRGQDIQLAGQQMTAATARAQARYQQMKDDRQYMFDREKFGEEQAKNNFETRQKAQKDLTDQIASMIPNGPDGKPDTQTASAHMSALLAHVGNRIAQLEQHLKIHPNDKQAAGELQGLQSRGVSQIDPRELQKFVTGMELKRKASETATGSLVPWGTSDSQYTGAPTRLREKPGTWFGTDYEIMQGTNKVGEIPGRHVTGGWFSQPDHRFDSLREKK